MLAHDSRAPRSVAIVTIVLVLTLSSSGPCAAQTADQVAAVERSVGILGDLLNASAIAMADIVANESTAASGQPTSCPAELNYACGQGSGRETVSNIDFALPIPAAADYVQLKRYDPPSAMASNATQRRLCSVAELGAHWNATQRRGQGNVLYQYWAGADNNFGSYPATAWNCSRPYVPTERPYYVAGATGQKDLVVLLDVSNSGGVAAATARVAIAKVAAQKLLGSLSFRDFVAILPYAGVVNTTLTPRSVQATRANVARLQAELTAIEIMPNGTSANLGAAVSGGVAMLNAGKSFGLSSACTQALVILAGNRSVDSSQDTTEALAKNPDVIAFAVMVAPASNSETGGGSVPRPAQQLRKVACAGNGLAATVTTPSNADAGVVLINDYFTTLLQNTVVRWSEVYTDAFGQGDILSGALPLYALEQGRSSDDTPTDLQGLVVMDVPLANLSLGGQLTAEVVNRILLNRQTCTPLEQRTSARDTVAQLQGDMCNDFGELAPEEVELRKIRGGLIAASVAVMFLCLGLPHIVTRVRGAKVSGLNIALTVAGLVCWIVFMSIFWTRVYEDIVSTSSYDRVTFTAVKYDDHPYRCCITTACTCSEYTNSSGVSCGDLVGKLEEGSCGNGYRCCAKVCRECNCRTVKSGKSRRRRCSTCCSCSRSVGDDRCSVRCGECYKPTVTITYEYRGERIVTLVVGSCGMDDYQCAQNWYDPYPLNTPTDGFVDPGNPYAVLTSVHVRLNFLIPACVFGALACICFLASMVNSVCLLESAASSSERASFLSAQQAMNQPDPDTLGMQVTKPLNDAPAPAATRYESFPNGSPVHGTDQVYNPPQPTRPDGSAATRPTEYDPHSPGFSAL